MTGANINVDGGSDFTWGGGMATARDARDWAHATLRGIGNSLYTPFWGTDGDDIDWDAYRTLVRTASATRHPCCGAPAASLSSGADTSMSESGLLEVAIEEARASIPMWSSRPARRPRRPRTAWS